MLIQALKFAKQPVGKLPCEFEDGAITRSQVERFPCGFFVDTAPRGARLENGQARKQLESLT